MRAKDKLVIFRSVFYAQLGVVAPGLYFLHGIFYTRGASSASLVIYLIKLSYLSVAVATFFLPSHHLRFEKRSALFLIFAYTLISSVALIGASVHSIYVSIFYLFADIIGHWITLVYVFLLLAFFRHPAQPNLLQPVVKLASVHLWGMTVALIAYYLYSDGGKVSTPYETQFVVSICLAAALLEKRIYTTPQFWITCVCIVLMAVITQMRVMLLSALFVLIAVGGYQLVVMRRLATVARSVTVSLALVVGGILLFPELVQDRWATLPLVGDPAVQVVDGIGDASINQRFVEISEVTDHVLVNPWVALVGAGFGGTYPSSTFTSDGYPAYQHHFHSTPLAIWFRLGFLGFCGYLLVLFVALKSMCSKDHALFIVGLAAVVQWVSGFTDLYYFWSFPFAFSVAALMFVKTGQRSA